MASLEDRGATWIRRPIRGAPCRANCSDCSAREMPDRGGVERLESAGHERQLNLMPPWNSWNRLDGVLHGGVGPFFLDVAEGEQRLSHGWAQVEGGDAGARTCDARMGVPSTNQRSPVMMCPSLAVVRTSTVPRTQRRPTAGACRFRGVMRNRGDASA